MSCSWIVGSCAYENDQDYDGRLSFATDAWTSPNHWPFVAITVHLEHDGQPIRLLLDVVGVAKVRTRRCLERGCRS